MITVRLPDGSARTLDAPAGLSVMEVLREAALIDGECNGSLACATCHVWVDAAFADRLAEPSDGEEDMLDVAFHLQPNSRLSCQITVGDATDGLVVTIPHKTADTEVV
ncbi:MAG: 2Fe-2S iron-sulfur cluster-binding protein [Pseudomonadota bacterium]